MGNGAKANEQSVGSNKKPELSVKSGDQAKVLNINDINAKILLENQVHMNFNPEAYQIPPELKANIMNVNKLIGPFKQVKKYKKYFQNCSKKEPIRINKHQIFIGDWTQGSQVGFGELIDLKGLYYIGYFFHNQYFGYGRMVYEDGSFYEGEWLLGKPTRSGRFYDKNGQITFEIQCPSRLQLMDQGPSIINNDQTTYYGPVKEKKRHGWGLFEWEDGTYYLGNFEEDKRRGIGLMKFVNGDQYDGGFFDNKYEGLGIMEYGDGRYYLGMHSNGLKHGFGILMGQNNIRFEGFFQEGKQEGKGLLYDIKSGQKSFGYWDKGVQLSKDEIKKRKINL